VALSPAVKKTGREGAHSPESNAEEVKNAWNSISIPPYVFIAWNLVKCRNEFTFTFYIPNNDYQQKVVYATVNTKLIN
jgi:hypothetical protein